jgi:hypothetical protein
VDNEQFECQMASERDNRPNAIKASTCDQMKFLGYQSHLSTAFKTHFVKFFSSRWDFFCGINILIAFGTFD